MNQAPTIADLSKIVENLPKLDSVSIITTITLKPNKDGFDITTTLQGEKLGDKGKVVKCDPKLADHVELIYQGICILTDEYCKKAREFFLSKN